LPKLIYLSNPEISSSTSGDEDSTLRKDRLELNRDTKEDSIVIHSIESSCVWLHLIWLHL